MVKTTSNKKMIMVDFAAQDRRSVKAQLGGYDDGRVAKHARFMREESLKNPLLSEEDLNQIYSAQCKDDMRRKETKTEEDYKSTWIGRVFFGMKEKLAH